MITRDGGKIKTFILTGTRTWPPTWTRSQKSKGSVLNVFCLLNIWVQHRSSHLVLPFTAAKENGYELPSTAKQVWFTSSDLTENMPKTTEDHITAKETDNQPHFLFSSFCTLARDLFLWGPFQLKLDWWEWAKSSRVKRTGNKTRSFLPPWALTVVRKAMRWIQSSKVSVAGLAWEVYRLDNSLLLQHRFRSSEICEGEICI